MRNGLSAYSGSILVDGHGSSANRGTCPRADGLRQQDALGPQVTCCTCSGGRTGRGFRCTTSSSQAACPTAWRFRHRDEAGIGGSGITVIAEKGFGSRTTSVRSPGRGCTHHPAEKEHGRGADSCEHSLYANAFNFRQRSVFWTSSTKDGYRSWSTTTCACHA